MDLEFDDAEVEVRRVRMPNADRIPKPYELSKEIFPRISVIERNMRPERMTVESEFVGRIHMSDDLRESPDDDPGEVTMTFIDAEGKLCRAAFMLSGEDLMTAHDASCHRRNVRVSGVLTGGRRKRIEGPHDLRIIS